MLKKNTIYTVEEILKESGLDYKDDLGKVKCTIGGIRGCTEADKKIKIPASAKELEVRFGKKKEVLKLKDSK